MELQTFVDQAKADPILVERMKTDPVGALQHAAAGSALTSDRFNYRIAILALSLIGLSCALGTMVLAFYMKDTPPAVIAFGSGALGALAGLIAPSQNKS